MWLNEIIQNIQSKVFEYFDCSLKRIVSIFLFIKVIFSVWGIIWVLFLAWCCTYSSCSKEDRRESWLKIISYLYLYLKCFTVWFIPFSLCSVSIICTCYFVYIYIQYRWKAWNSYTIFLNKFTYHWVSLIRVIESFQIIKEWNNFKFSTIM